MKISLTSDDTGQLRLARPERALVCSVFSLLMSSQLQHVRRFRPVSACARIGTCPGSNIQVRLHLRNPAHTLGSVRDTHTGFDRIPFTHKIKWMNPGSVFDDGLYVPVTPWAHHTDSAGAVL